jgi:DNA-damage-inducible protein D
MHLTKEAHMSDSITLPIPLPEESHDKRPLPEIIADYCYFPLAYHDVEDTRYYSIQDWIAGVALTEEPSKFWTDVKRVAKRTGIQLSDSIRQLPHKGANGKTYKMDFGPAEALYQITQRIRANTGIRDKVLTYLSKAGVVVDEIRIDPDKAIDAAIEAYRRLGKDEKWITARIQGKLMRLRFTAAFKNALRRDPSALQYAIITDEMRVGLWNRKTATLRAEMGLSEKANLREHMSTLALTYEMLAENISAEEMEQRQNLEFEESKAIVRKNSRHVGKHAEETSRMLGKDIVTGRPLLPEKTQ